MKLKGGFLWIDRRHLARLKLFLEAVPEGRNHVMTSKNGILKITSPVWGTLLLLNIIMLLQVCYPVCWTWVVKRPEQAGSSKVKVQKMLHWIELLEREQLLTISLKLWERSPINEGFSTTSQLNRRHAAHRPIGWAFTRHGFSSSWEEISFLVLRKGW